MAVPLRRGRARRLLTLALLPARANLCTATLDGCVYAIGGIIQDGTSTEVVEQCDPRADRWTPGQKLPQPRAAAGAAAVGGVLYVAGGEIPITSTEDEVTNSVLAYTHSPGRGPR